MPIFPINSVFLRDAGNAMHENKTLDTVVRFHDINRLPELQRCIFSLVGQNYRPLNIILTVQRFTASEIEETRQSLTPLLTGSCPPTLEIQNWNQSEPRDGRGFLLNTGIKVAKGRYLAFLDYDDTLYPEAYELLVSNLKSSAAAISFASVQLMQVHVYDSFSYTVGPVDPPPFFGKDLWDLFKSNFCPLHSYLFDRKKIPPEVLKVNTALSIEEDYDLLLRVCSQVQSDFKLVETVIGCYCFKNDGSNTVATDGLDAQTSCLYQQVCEHIEQQRRTTMVTSHVQTLLGLPEGGEPRTIRQLLHDRSDDCGQNYTIDSQTVGYRYRLLALRNRLQLIRKTVKDNNGFVALSRKIWSIYCHEGVSGIRLRLRNLIRSGV